MLSNRLSDSVRTAENRLSKKEKKRLAKLALEEGETDSCAQSDSNLDDKVNKYINIVNKKLRTLRKRMNKIEKYENCDKKELNADQITAIKKKPEVSVLIKEFEDLHKQYTLFDEHEQKEHENNKKLQEERLVNEIKEKVEKEKKLHSSQLQYLFKVNYALNIVINTSKITFSQSELNALSYVRNVLLGTNGMINENQKSEGEIVLEKLYEKSSDECCEGVSYKDVTDLIELIINPPQVGKKENCQTLSFFSQDATTDFNEQQPQPHQQLFFSSSKDEGVTHDMNEVSFAMSKINFMQPNECVEEEKEKNEMEVAQPEETINEQKQELNAEVVIKEVPTTENELNQESSVNATETATEEVKASVTEDKKSSEQLQQNSGYQNNQNNQFQKKRGYYRNGRGRRGYQNGQYNNRHGNGNGNGNGYKGSRNHGYYPQQNQNYASYYYNNRSTSF